MAALDLEKDPTFLRRSELVRNSPPDISLLLNPDKKWTTPQLLGTDFSAPDWRDRVEAIRKEARNLSKDLVVAVFFHGGTEGALASYSARQQQFEATKDFTGTDDTKWGIWDRGWPSEEHEHEVYHRDYLQFCGRVVMPAFDRATATLISRGFNMHVKDPIGWILYVCWQEPNTGSAHNNTSRLAREQGAPILSRGLGIIAGDEWRHTEAYSGSADNILRESQDDFVMAFYDFLRSKPQMPTRNMEGFPTYGKVVLSNGIFTGQTVQSVEDRMVERFRIPNLTGLSADAQKAQERVMILHEENRRKADELEERRQKGEIKMPDLSRFTWLI